MILAIFTFLLVGFGVIGFEYENDANLSAEAIPTEMNDHRYDIETTVSLTGSYTVDQVTDDIYIYTSGYAYQLSEYRNQHDILEFQEKLVVFGESQNTYYQRLRKYNYRAIDDMEMVPFLKTNNSGIYNDIVSFSDNPMFDIDRFWDGQSSVFPIAIEDLTIAQKEYVNEYLNAKAPGTALPEAGNIICRIETSGDDIRNIKFSYGYLFDDYSFIDQLITVSHDVDLNLSGLTSGALDVTDLSDIGTSGLPYLAEGDSLDYVNEYNSGLGQICFIEITEANEYLFVTDDDNNDSAPQWDIYDLEFNSYFTRLQFAYNGYYDDNQTSIYLEPGVYFLYLGSKEINVNAASITYTAKSVTDDMYNSDNPYTLEVTGDGSYSFSIDYAYDVDAFRLVSDYDCVVIDRTGTYAIGVDYYLDMDLKETGLGKVVDMPESGELTLFMSSPCTGDYEIAFSFYNYTSTPVAFSECPSIDIYDPNNTTTIAVPFQGGVDRYRFEVSENSEIYILSDYASINIYDSTINLVSPEETNIYQLTAGTYYLELHDFLSNYATFGVYPEASGSDVFVLDDALSEYQLVGFVSGYEDVDIYQFTLDQSSLIGFVSDDTINLLIYGVDNPKVMIRNCWFDTPIFLPAGTYRVTLPKPGNFGYQSIYGYKLIMTKTPYPEEPNEEISCTSFSTENEVTTYDYTVHFDYYSDDETIAIDLASDQEISFTYDPNVVNATIYYVNDGVYTNMGWAYMYNTLYNENNHYKVTDAGKYVVVFSYRNYIISEIYDHVGDFDIAIHVYEEGDS